MMNTNKPPKTAEIRARELFALVHGEVVAAFDFDSLPPKERDGWMKLGNAMLSVEVKWASAKAELRFIYWIERLTAQGLLPSPHNLELWQHADGSGFGVSILCRQENRLIEAHGKTLREAVKQMMRQTGRGADIQEH